MTAPTSPPTWQPTFEHVCALGESPFWHPQEQLLYWVDIAGRQVLRGDPQTGRTESWDMPSEPGCIAPAQQGGLVLALRHGIFRANHWGAPLRLIATLPYDTRTMRANDGKCDALGRFWVGTIDETRQSHNASLWCIDARQAGAAKVIEACEVLALRATTANALAWSPAGDQLYWADTPSHRVWRWQFDGASAHLSEQTLFAQFEPKPDNWQLHFNPNANHDYAGRPDGATVDAQGNYWVAMYEGQRVCQFAADGALRQSLPTPLLCPTMPCLGGADLQTLFVSSVGQHRSAAELRAWPWSGKVLACRVDTPGLPVHGFQESTM